MSDYKDHDKDIDDHTGIETTGHEWDGIKELNNPLPRWWLWLWLICCIWGFAYQIAMPAWPLVSDYTKGMLGYSQRDLVRDEIAQARAERNEAAGELLTASLQDIKTNPDLFEFALAGGKAAFGDNCAGCHGTGASGAKGYPNLNDDDWLWGGSLDEIHETISVGVRGVHEDTRLSEMPAFLRDEILSKEEVNALTMRVMAYNDSSIAVTDETKELFQDNCASCHGEDGAGGRDFGAPNLTDAIWLYGKDAATIRNTISFSRAGVMPTWDGRLDAVTIKSLAVYVHTLGGGE